MPGRERYDLAFSIVLGMGDHQAMKDLVDETLANALASLVDSHAIEEWQVSADSVDLEPFSRSRVLTPTEIQLLDSQHDQMIADELFARGVLFQRRRRAEPPPADPRTQKDEPGQ